MSSFQPSKLFNVSGKVVLITGGSRGIGKMVRPRLFSTPASGSLIPAFPWLQIAAGFVSNGAKVSTLLSNPFHVMFD